MDINSLRTGASVVGILAAFLFLIGVASCTMEEAETPILPMMCVGYGGGAQTEQICSQTVTMGNKCAWHIDVFIVGGAPGDTVTGTCGTTTATCTVAVGQTGCTDGKGLDNKTTPFTCSSTTRGSYGCGATDP